MPVSRAYYVSLVDSLRAAGCSRTLLSAALYRDRGDLVVCRRAQGHLSLRFRPIVGLTALLVFMLLLGACSDSGTDVGPRPRASSTPSVSTTSSPTATPASSSPSPVSSPTPTEEPTDEPSPTTRWTPPADPSSQGPTVAPDLPVEEGGLDEPIDLNTGIDITLNALKHLDVEPRTPGEYSGPAIIVEISVHNGADEVQNLDSAVVTLTTADGEVGIATTAGPNKPLKGDIDIEETVAGSYVFMLDPSRGRTVTISVNYAAGEPVAEFTGQIT